jgi:ADP-ribosylation factor related protein 1
VGKITLPSTILQFWDLGGQRGIRSIWPRYYDDCHAVVYVIDAKDRERLGEGWEVFGVSSPTPLPTSPHTSPLESVLSSPQTLGVPLLLLANKQDSPESLSVEEIRTDYEGWHQRKKESSRRSSRYGEEFEGMERRERMASLDVMGVSALTGWAISEVVAVFVLSASV